MALRSQRFINNQRIQRAATNSPPLKKVETSDAVKLLQKALIDLGLLMPKSTKGGASAPDGIFGDETQATVMRFQREEGLLADGIAGKKTLERLDEIWAARESRVPRPVTASDWSASTHRKGGEPA